MSWILKLSKLGDILLHVSQNDIEKQMENQKILIDGNHDAFSKTKWRKLGFEPHEHYIYQDYLFTHIPVDEQPLQIAIDEGFLKANIHGHTHSNISHLNQEIYWCACVELHDYKPVLFSDFTSSHAPN